MVVYRFFARWTRTQYPASTHDAQGTRRSLRAAVARADALAVRLAARPWRAFALLLAANLVLAACFVAGGLAFFDDQAELFRELQPATILSFGQLLFVAAIAWAVHRRVDQAAALVAELLGAQRGGVPRIRLRRDHPVGDLRQPCPGGLVRRASAGGFHDLEAVLLTLLFATVAVTLLPRALVLMRHPRALALLGMAVGLGAASQGLDSFAAATQWEFVAEEALKLAAEVFFIGGFLLALRDVTRQSATRPEPAASAAQPA